LYVAHHVAVAGSLEMWSERVRGHGIDVRGRRMEAQWLRELEVEGATCVWWLSGLLGLRGGLTTLLESNLSVSLTWVGNDSPSRGSVAD
jgi:hypothetical protein